MFRCRTLTLASLLIAAWNQVAGAAGLMEAYRDAAASDPQIMRAAANRDASLEAKPQARALLLPDLRAGAAGTRNFAVNVDPGTTDSAFNDSNISVDVAQPLYDRGARAQVRQAESIVDQAQADYLAAEQELILRVAQLYFDVLGAADQLTFRVADKNAIARQLEQAKRRFEVGLITITDVQEAQARFDLAVADEIIARNNLEDTREALREVTGKYYEQLDELSQRMPLVSPEPASPEDWVKQALQTNPQILSAAFAVETARESIEVQRSGHYPTVDLVAGYDKTDTGVIVRRGASVGLQINVPLYQGGAVMSRTREAAFQHEASKDTLEAQQRSAIRQARDGYRGVLASISAIKAYNQAQVSNQSSLEATEAGFDVGTRTIVDVLDAQRDLFAARRDYSLARYAYVLNHLRLKQAAGQISVADLEKIQRWLEPPKAPPTAETSR